MNSEILLKIKNFTRISKRQHVIRNIAVILCCAVFLFTGYSLAFRGITLTASKDDIIEAEQGETQNLILQCQVKQEDILYHEHNKYCYDADGNLVCNLELNPPPEISEAMEATDTDASAENTEEHSVYDESSVGQEDSAIYQQVNEPLENKASTSSDSEKDDTEQVENDGDSQVNTEEKVPTEAEITEEQEPETDNVSHEQFSAGSTSSDELTSDEDQEKVINNDNSAVSGDNSDENDLLIPSDEKQPEAETDGMTPEEIESLTHIHTAACCISDEFTTEKEFEDTSVTVHMSAGVLPVTENQLIYSFIQSVDEKDIYAVINNEDNKYDICYAYDIKLSDGENELMNDGGFNVTLNINSDIPGVIKEIKTVCIYKDGTVEEFNIEQLDAKEFSFDTTEFCTVAVLINTETVLKSLAKGAGTLLRGDGPIQGNFEDGYTNVPESSYLYALIDDSTNIGVPYEGSPYIENDPVYGSTEKTFPDSTYIYEENFTGSGHINIDAIDSAQKVGGIIWGFSDAALVHKNYIAEQLWDGNAPFRVSGLKAATPVLHFNYNELQLEDGTHLTNWGKVDTYINGMHINTAPLKLDNWYIEHHNIGSNHNYLYGRGNKIVIGENITQQDPVTARELSNGMYAIEETNGFVWGIYGGSENSSHSTSCRTNVVVASGGWSFIYGGGNSRASCYQDTNVAIRGGIVNEVYGGSNNASVGASDKNTIINIYDGIVGQVFGGNEIDSAAGSYVHGNVEVNVSGGHVNIVKLGSDLFTPYRRYLDGTNVNNNKNILNSCATRGSATLNITGTGHAKNVYGDDFRNMSFGDPGANYVGGYRRIKGPTTLNVSASNEFNEMEYFDVVNIAGPNVVVRTENTTGDGYIGSISVKDGATLYIDNGGIINIPYDTTYETYLDKNLVEVDTGNTIYTLHHAWNGEELAADRAASRLLIDGQGVVTAASSTLFNNSTDSAALRIHGYVEGYSVLEVNDTPIYSDDTNYYYYVIANASNVGAAAFQEPAGADYIVCYRHLKDENNNDLVGWYLREKPSISIDNVLYRAGETASLSPMTAHIELNGLQYEWSDIPGSNHVEFGWTSKTGVENATFGDNNYTLSQITDITEGSHDSYTAVFDNGRLSSIDIVINNDTPIDPIYATSYINYRYIDTNFTGMDYTDRAGNGDGVIAVYDFAGNDNLHPNEGYTDSVMTTSPYSETAKGADDALLRVYLPENVTATLSVAEDDNVFEMTDSGNAVNLVNSNTITTNFTETTPNIFNNNFGVNISNGELVTGYTQQNLSGITKLPCSVFSYRNVDYSDVSKRDSDGLCLTLTLSDIEYSGKPVSAQNEPSAVNNGELQIQATPYIISLTIEKTIIGIADSAAPFTMVIRDSNDSVVIPSSGQSYSVDENGNITFSLSDGESITIPDITSGSTYFITQNNVDGFNIVYKEGNTQISTQNSCSQTIYGNKTITVLNIPASMLPSTGGMTEWMFLISGSFIILLVLVFFFVFRRKINILNKIKKEFYND